MRKFIKAISLSLMALMALMATGCGGRLEQPDWLKQTLCEHEFELGDVIREGTCTTKGKQQEYCSECGATRILSTPEVHKYDSGVAGGNGLTYYTCMDCGTVKTEVLGVCYHENIISEEGFVKNGMCQDCGRFVFNQVTYSEVSRGDTLAGWYKIVPNGTDDIMLFIDSMDIPELEIEGLNVSDPYEYSISEDDFNICDMIYFGVFAGAEGVNKDINSFMYSEPTYSTIRYHGHYYVYVPPKGYKCYYSLEHYDSTREEYVIYGSIAYTFTNFKMKLIQNGSIQKVNFN